MPAAPTAVFVQNGDALDHTPGADVAAGAVVVQGELVGVARTPIKASTLGSIAVAGVFDFPKSTASSISAGANTYWDAAAQQATTNAAAGANKLIGKATRTANTADPTVRVRLNQ